MLLILAGVAISQITGNSNVLNKAQKASDETVKAEELGNVQLAVAKVMVNNESGLGKVTNEKGELRDALKGIATISGGNGYFCIVAIDGRCFGYKQASDDEMGVSPGFAI